MTLQITRVGRWVSRSAWGALALVAGQVSAQGVVYRCPGPPVLYTDAMTAKEAAEKGCRSIEGTPISVIAPIKPRAPTAGGSGPVVGSQSADLKVDAKDQRVRDDDRRRILEQELREAEGKLAKLQQEYNNGQPDRRGDERNYQKYLDRTAELKAAVSRQEADIQALKRELGKLP
ncbi:hypothetical protein [Mitsuaria sp. GD03876]|uniref:hypothetical protein n=1 Tax=Mitsuaria sp. GD03876 TaxID=2975399 RepID=UPI00244C2C64|nr:hypothetical protein [Mitsuaria sp. GD03876]MDH0864337.1 hypothetical protein [Mitsuaria sp. GD03876]